MIFYLKSFVKSIMESDTPSTGNKKRHCAHYTYCGLSEDDFALLPMERQFKIVDSFLAKKNINGYCREIYLEKIIDPEIEHFIRANGDTAFNNGILTLDIVTYEHDDYGEALGRKVNDALESVLMINYTKPKKDDWDITL